MYFLYGIYFFVADWGTWQGEDSTRIKGVVVTRFWESFTRSMDSLDKVGFIDLFSPFSHLTHVSPFYLPPSEQFSSWIPNLFVQNIKISYEFQLSVHPRKYLQRRLLTTLVGGKKRLEVRPILSNESFLMYDKEPSTERHLLSLPKTYEKSGF